MEIERKKFCNVLGAKYRRTFWSDRERKRVVGVKEERRKRVR